MVKKSKKLSSKNRHLRYDFVVVITLVSAVLGYTSSLIVNRRDNSGVMNNQPQGVMVRKELLEEQVAQYKSLVDSYNQLAQQTSGIIDEHNRLVPVIKSSGIKPEGAGANYFPMLYVAPKCMELVQAPYAPISVGDTKVYSTQQVTC